MKKYLWIVALLAALSMVMTGCDTGGSKTPGNEDGEKRIFFKLSDEIKKMVDSGIATNTELDVKTVFTADFTAANPLPITNAGDVKIKIVPNGSAYAFEIDTATFNWGAGLDLIQAKIGFKAGDEFEVTGKILAAFPPAPSSGDTWASPQIYFNFGSGDPKTEEIPSPPVGPYSFKQKLTAAGINKITTSNPPTIRIGARPAGAKFTIDEITVTRVVPKEPAKTFTVTFLDTDKTKILGTVTGIESGLMVPPATTSAKWYTDFMAAIPEGKKFGGWKNKTGDAVWDLKADTVTADVSLYAVIVDAAAIADGFFELGPFDDGTKTWGINGTDNWTNNLTSEIVAGAKYFIALLHTDSLNGAGGMQFHYQGDGYSNWDNNATAITPDWTGLQPDLGEYGSSIDFYAVVNLSTLPNWAAVAGGTQAKFTLNWPTGWSDNNFDFVTGYFCSKDLTKPAISKDMAKDGTTYGWFAVTLPEIIP